MRGQYIEFISAYCDRWCERCAFTDRCSAHAIQVAIEMCEGDVRAGTELAVGAPPPMTEAERKRREKFLASLPDVDVTPAERVRFDREREAKNARIEQLPVTTLSEGVMLLSRTWLDDHGDTAAAHAGNALQEAIAVARWDCYFLYAKLRRALNGRDEAAHGQRWAGEDKIQNDWNGSAKVALVSIERSIQAWTTIADATADPDAAHVASELQKLRQEVDLLFPNARKFHRPGFDGLRRKRWWR
jgi:hypothetical protein